MDVNHRHMSEVSDLCQNISIALQMLTSVNLLQIHCNVVSYAHQNILFLCMTVSNLIDCIIARLPL